MAKSMICLQYPHTRNALQKYLCFLARELAFSFTSARAFSTLIGMGVVTSSTIVARSIEVHAIVYCAECIILKLPVVMVYLKTVTLVVDILLSLSW